MNNKSEQSVQRRGGRPAYNHVLCLVFCLMSYIAIEHLKATTYPMPPLYVLMLSIFLSCRSVKAYGSLAFRLRSTSIACAGGGRSTALASFSFSRKRLRLQSTSAASTTCDQTSPSASLFEVVAPYEPTGDQPQAIANLHQQLLDGQQFNVLKGATGTGKTFVMSHIIARNGKPTLIMVHNKTLAAQLARELRSFFPNNAVELFISSFKSYVPESYNESAGRYIAKKSVIDAQLEALRHSATRALVTRKDVVVVASVSCIYGLGLPSEYLDASTALEMGQILDDDFIHALERMLYDDNGGADDTFKRGEYQCRNSVNQDGSMLKSYTVWPPQEVYPVRAVLRQLAGESYEVTGLFKGNSTGMKPIRQINLFPARHYVVPDDHLDEALLNIEEELQGRVKELLTERKVVEAERLQKRTLNDLMMIRERGFCKGMENYSRHLSGRAAGEPPATLMDYLGDEWLLIVDESHATLPQLSTMYGADLSRKCNLVKHGYRLPSAIDNRPLTDLEFWERVDQTVFVSATPSRHELGLSQCPPVEMQIRPTYVCDPVIEIRKPEGQLEDLLSEVKARREMDQRALAMVLTKEDAENLASYLQENGVASTYIHSGLDTQGRSDALKALQSGEVDCLVGVNLLREGLDIPQCSLVAILNADSDGMFRSQTTLLQTIGRAARNVDGKAVFYAKRVTENMRKCIEETENRRLRQLEYNRVNRVQMVSSVGSSLLSPFELFRDKIESEIGLEVPVESRAPSGFTSQTDSNSLEDNEQVVLASISLSTGTPNIETDHIPSTPGVYFWRDSKSDILYIGKANNLRSRIKSYLRSSAKQSSRIKTMLGKVSALTFELTPSHRDALILESKLIKHHQPPYNVLLKDDEHYPYICATVGDKLPRFMVAPFKGDHSVSNRQYRYFGPYTSFQEINVILQNIEEKYDLRAQSFLVRHGNQSVEDYRELFYRALQDVFIDGSDRALLQKRVEYEEGGLLFDSVHNACRDVVVAATLDGDETSALVHIVQLREGLVAGRFAYPCQVSAGLHSEQDYADVIQAILEKQHYPSGQESGQSFSFFPDEVLVTHALPDASSLRKVVNTARSIVEPSRRKGVIVNPPATRGSRKLVDARVLQFAMENAQQLAHNMALKTNNRYSVSSSVDGTAAKELASLLALSNVPKIIECYDVSHTQGDFPVASRVVFVDGKPAPHLYRRFNIKSVEGVDDYASIRETVRRRFERSWTIEETLEPLQKQDPWALPDLVVIDGGIGQLSAAIKGMAEAQVFPGNSTYVNSAGEHDVRRATVPIASLAKDQEHLFVPGQRDYINRSSDSPAMLLLRSLRDESHRFALKAHREKRSVTKAYRHSSNS